MNKKVVLLLISLLWITLAVGLVKSKEFLLKNGKSVLLETLPADPRDLLRGDYVILNYKINTLDLNLVRSEKSSYNPGEKVFVRLEPRGRYWGAVAVQTKQDFQKQGDPAVYIKGRVKYYSHFKENSKMTVDYGIGSYFVPEGEGKEIERNIGRTKSAVDVEVVVGDSGLAVIKDVVVNRRSIK